MSFKSDVGMSRRRTTATGYTKLDKQADVTDGFSDEQFQTKARFPWKTAISVLLFAVAGTISLTFSFLLATGVFDEKYDDRVWPLFILGILMFIPGGYYGYVLLSICLKRDGYSLDDIPEL